MKFADRKLFEPQRLEEERALDKSFVITIRVNMREKAMIDRIRALLDIEGDSKALKKAAEIGLNVILSTFGEEMIKYLCSGKRERKSDYEGHPPQEKRVM